jgi:uncharacterized integral membrane protein
MSDQTPIGAPAAAEQRKERGRIATWMRQPKTIVGAVVTALTVWFILVNTAETRIHFWVVWVTVKLWVALVITLVAGLIVGVLLMRRSDARQRRRRRE